MTTPTANPVPSNSPKDLLFNAEKLDEVINGTEDTYTDRLGVERLTTQGAMKLIGYEPPVAFASGLTITRATQTVTNGGLLYHAAPGAVPFSTTGSFVAGQWMLVSNVTAQDLANTSDATNGDFLIGVKRTDIASAAAMTLHDWNQAERVNVRQVGVKGDGSTDDAALLNTLGALGIPLFVPYTSTGYKIGSTVTFNCDVFCEGFFTPAAAIGSAPADYNRFAIVLASAGFGVGRRFYGIKVQGSGALRTAGVSGIRNDCEDSTLRECRAPLLNYGIVARSYSQTYDRCSAQLCNVPFAAYARSTSLEINALSIRGGTYDSALTAAMIIGDTSWSDAMAAGNRHGVNIVIGDGVSTDGSEVRIDNVAGVNVCCYAEGSNTAQLVRLGGSGDGNLRNVEIAAGSFFKSAEYAVRCYSAVEGLTVRPATYEAITRSAIYVVSDIYRVTYERGTNIGSFAQGQEIHTGFRSLPIGSVTWGWLTIPYQGLLSGGQNCTDSPGVWYPGGLKQLAASLTRMNASSAGRFYDAPATGKSGTVSGNVFSFTTLADCYSFNGGDRIATSPAGAAYVRSVDYAAGTMVMDGGVTANGPATVSQQLATFA